MTLQWLTGIAGTILSAFIGMAILVLATQRSKAISWLLVIVGTVLSGCIGTAILVLANHHGENNAIYARKALVAEHKTLEAESKVVEAERRIVEADRRTLDAEWRALRAERMTSGMLTPMDSTVGGSEVTTAW
jgi:cell division protein FtsL